MSIKRGVENNPTSYELWKSLGLLYQDRLHDYYRAAYCYGRASQFPDAPHLPGAFSLPS